MNVLRCIAVSSGLMLAVIAGTSAQAQSPVDECFDRIDLVKADLDAVYAAGGIGGGNPDRTYNSLVSKLDGAAVKLQQGKTADALRKLQDFADAVIALRDAVKQKLSDADAALLLDGGNESDIDEGVNGAIACVEVRL